MRTNCINCGAAIDTDVDKCPFCGTSYFDLTAIDFTSHSPVALRLKVPHDRNNNILISMLAIPQLGNITHNVESVNVIGGMGGQCLAQVPISVSVDVGVTFTAVNRNGMLYQARRDTNDNP